MQNAPSDDRALLTAAFARLDPVALAVALGSVWGVLMFLATAVLLVKHLLAGGPLGPHLSLLGAYLPGFTVSWPGALLGAAYACLLGALVALALAGLWNLSHRLYIAWAIAQVGRDDSRTVLSQAAAAETDPQVLEEIKTNLKNL